jgi:hypothetical protein
MRAGKEVKGPVWSDQTTGPQGGKPKLTVPICSTVYATQQGYKKCYILHSQLVQRSGGPLLWVKWLIFERFWQKEPRPLLGPRPKVFRICYLFLVSMPRPQPLLGAS